MADDQQPLDLRAEAAIDLGYATDFHILLRAIVDAIAERRNASCLEGAASRAPAVTAFLEFGTQAL